MCNTGDYIQYLLITCNGKESEKEYMCVCMYVCVYIYIHTDIYIDRYLNQIPESLCYVPETNNIVNQLHFIFSNFLKVN